jgi:hypothetical protein
LNKFVILSEYLHHRSAGINRTPSSFLYIMATDHKPDPSSYPSLNYGPGAKWVKNLTRDRLNNFHGGHYSGLNISSVLFAHRANSEEFVNLKVWVPQLLFKEVVLILFD